MVGDAFLALLVAFFITWCLAVILASIILHRRKKSDPLKEMCDGYRKSRLK